VCGWDGILLGSRKISKPEKHLKIAQNPTRRLHALLGAVELEDSLTEKDTIANRLKFLHTT
jgi:hypothetical protein